MALCIQQAWKIRHSTITVVHIANRKRKLYGNDNKSKSSCGSVYSGNDCRKSTCLRMAIQDDVNIYTRASYYVKTKTMQKAMI